MAARDTLRNIEDLRASLSERLEELHRRANTATAMLSPLKRWRETYWRNPMVRFGLGAVMGFAIGGRRAGTAQHEGILHAIVRAGLMAATTSLVTRALTAGSGDTEDQA